MKHDLTTLEALEGWNAEMRQRKMWQERALIAEARVAELESTRKDSQ